MREFFKKIFFLIELNPFEIIKINLQFIIISFLEILSLSIFGIFLTKFVNGNYSNNNEWLNLGNYNFYLLGVILVSIFIFKTFIYLYLQNKILKFAYNHQTNLRMKLLSAFFNMNYLDFIKVDSAKRIQHSVNIVNQFTRQIIINLLRIVSESLFLLLIIIYLAFVDLITVLILTIFFILLFLIYYLTVRKTMYNFGSKVTIADQEIIKNIKELINGIKEIKLFNKEKFFINTIKDISNSYAKFMVKFDLYTLLPRAFNEIALIIITLSIVTYFYFIKTDVTQLIPLLGVFLIAGLRMMPSLNILMHSFNNLKFAQYPLNEIFDEVNKVKTYDNSHDEFNFLTLNINNLQFSYNANKIVINNLSLNFNKGSFIGIYGKSGSGKSTLINLILGLLEPTSGEIKINNKYKTYNNRNWWNKICYIPQSNFLINKSPRENVILDLDSNIDEKYLEDCFKKARIHDLYDVRSPVGDNGINLSGGQQQRIAIARALFFKREILILDEFTSSLDSLNENEILDEIINFKELKTVFLISHKKELLFKCDKILVFENNKITEKFQI